MMEWLNELYELTEQFRECKDPDGRMMIADLTYDKLSKLNVSQVKEYLYHYRDFIDYIDHILPVTNKFAEIINENKKGE